MYKIIKNLYYIYSNYEFEVFIVGVCVVILILAIFRRNEEGKWTSMKYMSFFNNDINKKNITTNYKEEIENVGYKKESRGETECRRVLEKIFKRRFIKTRPNFLNNPVTGGKYNLEIDCYNDELRLGLEYNGRQHYEYSSHFHKNKEDFLNQKYRDVIKKSMCKDNDVNLIEVPYTVKIEDIEYYIIGKLEELRYL